MQILKKCLFFTIIAPLVLFSSCNSTKQIVYFQGDTLRYKKLELNKPSIVRIKHDDILGISISSLNEEFNKIFEMPIAGGLRYMSFPGAISSNQGVQPLGYLVDSSGMVELPLIGKIHLEGLSFSEASDSIKLKLDQYLKSPSVNVRVLNHRYTILGEVNRPSTYNLLDNSVNILEAIGMAGDMTIYGRRDNVLLIREEQKKRVQVRLNLLSQDILSSEYYYIKNGDMIYVEPSGVKATYNDRTYQLLPIVTSVIAGVTSLGVLLLNVTK